MITLHLHLLDDGLDPEIENELGPFAGFTFSLDRPSHFLDDLFAYGETKSSALLVDLRVLIEFAKINEQIIQALLRYAHASVFNAQAETDEALLATRRFLPIFGFVLLVSKILDQLVN